jgi:hypothetical protein
MASKKIAQLSSDLVAVKGKAQPAEDAPTRSLKVETATTATPSTPTPLNFKVDADFRRRFRQRAAESDLKLNELLKEALAAWEEKKGLTA